MKIIKSVAITGHCPQDLYGFPKKLYESEEYNLLRARLRRVFVAAIEKNGTEEFIFGMALGTDQVALAVAIELKSKYNIKLVAAVPFRGQEDAWSFPTRALYACLLNKCDEIVYTDEMGGSSKLAGYDVSKLYARSKYMVQRADGVIAVWNGKESGGTYDAVRLAKTAGKPVAIIDPRNLNGITRA